MTVPMAKTIGAVFFNAGGAASSILAIVMPAK
jgi:hypothetical protein